MSPDSSSSGASKAACDDGARGPRHALVFGASGLVGRHLVLALAASGATVTAAVRTAESGARVQRWLRQHGLSREIGTTLWEPWWRTVLGDGPAHIIGHSLGAAAAVAAADRFPERVASLALVAPFFLQPAPSIATRVRPLVSALLRHSTAAGLSRRLTGSNASASALESSVADLRRGRAARVAVQLARTSSPRWRRELRDALGRFEGPVRIITGSDDPLAAGAAAMLAALPHVDVVSLPGAGHHPHLTHGADLVRLLANEHTASGRHPSDSGNSALKAPCERGLGSALASRKTPPGPRHVEPR